MPASKGTKRKATDGIIGGGDTKRKRIQYSAQLMDILGYEHARVSGKRYEPGQQSLYSEDLEVMGWDFLLENVDMPEKDFERKLDRMIKTTDVIGKLDDEKRTKYQNSILEAQKLAYSKLYSPESTKSVGKTRSDGLRQRKKVEASKTDDDIKASKKVEQKTVEKKVDSEIVYEFGGPIGAASIMIISHLIMYYLWLAVSEHEGNLFIPSISDAYAIYEKCAPKADIWMKYLTFIFFQLVLGMALPGFEMKGLPIPSEGYKCLLYNCNGLGAWWLTLAAAIYLEYTNKAISSLSDRYGELMTVMIIFGNLVAVGIYLSGFILGRTYRMSGNHIYDFFMGSWLNPRIGDFDLKVWGEVRVSWFTLFLLTFSCWLKAFENANYNVLDVHPGLHTLLIAHWLYTNACVKGEECIVTTWDIFYEKWGWMLIFWNFAGVPIVYTWNSFYILKTNPPMPFGCGCLLIGILLVTYYIWDTANSQKNYFRMQLRGTYKTRPWYVFPQLPWRTVTHPAAILTERGSWLLISGWYGFSKTRKIHYLMDILFALEWGLAAGFRNFLPYFYLVFFSSFIAHRGIRDNERCAKKYGKDWDRYCSYVPYVLIPGIW